MDQAITAPDAKMKLHRTWQEQQHVTRARIAHALRHPVINKYRGKASRTPATQRISFWRACNRGACANNQPDTVKPARRIAPMQAEARANQRAGAGNNIIRRPGGGRGRSIVAPNAKAIPASAGMTIPLTRHSASANHCPANAARRENWRHW